MTRNILLRILPICCFLCILQPPCSVASTGSDTTSYVSDDWDDVNEALIPFEKDDVYNNINQKCNACTFIGQQIMKRWTKYAYKLKKWSKKKKLTKAKAAINKACTDFSTMQICLTGDKGFQDFNVLMQSGIISNINMNGKFTKHLSALCNVLKPRLLDVGIHDKMTNVEKIYDYNLQLNICQEIIPACGKRKNGENKDGKKKRGGGGKKRREKRREKRRGKKREQVKEVQEDDLVNERDDDIGDDDVIEL